MTEACSSDCYCLTPGQLSNQPLELTNAQFFQTAFHLSADGIHPFYVSFLGKPHNGNWVGTLYNGSNAPERKDRNNYFSVSVFAPDAKQQYHRRKDNFAGQYVVALDDVVAQIKDGETKAQIPMNRIMLPPSYIVETSTGNFQVGFLLEQPITSLEEAQALSDDIIAAGLSDPGANGPSTRLMRLPVGCNGKHIPAFPCALRLWEPQRRYCLQALRTGLQLPLARALTLPSATSKQTLPPQTVAALTNINAVYQPAPTVNRVLESLRGQGLVKRTIAPGKYDITCPWCVEHTNQEDSGTVYWVPDEERPLGAFKCQHGHCAGRGILQLLEFLHVEPDDAYMTVRILIRPNEIKRIVSAVERVLAQTKLFYQRGGRVVRLLPQGPDAILSVQEVNQSALLLALGGLTRWYHYDARKKKNVQCDPSGRYLQTFLESGQHPFLPELIGLAQQPTITANGEVCLQPGYNPETKLYGAFAADAFQVSPHPTKAEAQQACQELKDLLQEFPFEQECDLSAALAAMLTAAVRTQLPLAPLMHVRAHLPGSGKSHLTSLIALFATGLHVSPTPMPKDEEECGKLLLSELQKAPAVVVFDNLTSDLYPFRSLCMVLTEERFTGRILGESRTAQVSTRALFLSSGNNVGPVQDMTRRVLTINLNPLEEIPATRTFQRPHLLDEVRLQRPHYVSCALTIISAWNQAGKPRDARAKPLNSYEQWSDWCRQPLLWLGLPDPVERLFTIMNEDPEREQVGRILAAWRERWGGKPFTVKNIAATVAYEQESELFDALNEAGFYTRNELDRRRLGWWFKHKEGWAVNGLKLVKYSVKGKQPYYQVIEVAKK